MTNVSIFTVEPTKDLKPIEFIWRLSETLKNPKLDKAICGASDYKNVVLITRGGKISGKIYYDTMLAWDDEINKGMIYLGYFNDGVVE